MTARGGRLAGVGIALYCAALFAAWTLCQWMAQRHFAAWLHSPWAAETALGALKLLVWTLPALLLAGRYAADMAVMPLFAVRTVRWPRLLLCTAAIAAFQLASGFIGKGALRFAEGFHPSALLGTVLLVGITEEAVFRGFLLNALVKRLGKAVALAVSAALFMLIHYPLWGMTTNVFASPLLLLRDSVGILALGILFGWFFLEDRSLLSPILLHMVWNFTVLLR